MNRQAFFNPFFGPFPGFAPFYGPFGFPRRRLFPFFFFSPYRFPFFRDDERNEEYYSRHHCKKGETMESLAEMYNVPRPVLEAVNPHIANPAALAPGSTVHVPRMNRMYCQRMFAELEAAPSAGPIPMQEAWMNPAAGPAQTGPWMYAPTSAPPAQTWTAPAYGMPPTGMNPAYSTNSPATQYPGLRKDEEEAEQGGNST